MLGEEKHWQFKEILNLYRQGKSSFINKINELYDNYDIEIYYLQSRRKTEILIFPLTEDAKIMKKICQKRHEKLPPKFFKDCSFITFTLDDIRDDIIEYHGRKCVICGISEQRHMEKYGRPLELHHVFPICFSDSMYGIKLTDAFVPVCSVCHRRGYQ